MSGRKPPKTAAQLLNEANESTLRFLARAFLVGRKSAIGEIPRERGGGGAKK